MSRSAGAIGISAITMFRGESVSVGAVRADTVIGRALARPGQHR